MKKKKKTVGSGLNLGVQFHYLRNTFCKAIGDMLLALLVK